MSPDDPRHGTTKGYAAHQADGEKTCPACTRAKQDYYNHARRQRAYGRWQPWADATPVREHVQRLMANGTSIRRISEAVGVPTARVSYLLYGRGTKTPPIKVRPEFAAAVLAVRDNPARVPTLRVARRLAALIALGYTQPWIAQQLGCSQGHIWRYLNLDAQFVTRRRFDAVRDLYDRHSMTLPPTRTRVEKYAASRARNTASRRGFVPPLAWNDIDDPNESPRRDNNHARQTDVDPVVVERSLAGDILPTTRAEKIEITRRWEAQGRSLNELARTFGWKSERYTIREKAAS